MNITGAEGTNDRLTVNMLDGDDSLIVDTGGSTNLGLMQLIYNAGSGANSLSVLSGSSADRQHGHRRHAGHHRRIAGAHSRRAGLTQNQPTLVDNSHLTLLSGRCVRACLPA